MVVTFLIAVTECLAKANQGRGFLVQTLKRNLYQLERSGQDSGSSYAIRSTRQMAILHLQSGRRDGCWRSNHFHLTQPWTPAQTSYHLHPHLSENSLTDTTRVYLLATLNSVSKLRIKINHHRYTICQLAAQTHFLMSYPHRFMAIS